MPLRALVGRHWAIALVLAAATPLYLIFTHSDEVISSFSDSVVYLLTARHFASPLAAIYSEIAAQSPYPPLYPLLLALAGGGENVAAAHAATTAALLLALVALYAWLRRLGVAPTTAAAGVLVTALLPGLYVDALLVMSENLFLLCGLLALLLLEPQPKSLRSFALAALWVCAATMTRSVGVTLFVPLAFAAWRCERRAAAFALVGLALVPMVLWSMGQKPIASYTDALRIIYGSDPLHELMARAPLQIKGIFEGIIEDLAGLSHPGWLASVAAVLLIGSAVVRAVQLRADGLFVAAYAAVLLIWPYPTELSRLSLMILPVMIVQMLVVARSLPVPAGTMRWLGVGAATACLAFLVPILLGNVARFRLATDIGLAHARSNPYWYDADADRALWRVKVNDATVSALQRIGEFVAPEDCVYMLRPALVTFYSGRRAVVPPLEETDDDRFTKRLLEGCRYIVLRDSDSPAGTLRMFPSSRIRVPLAGVDAGTLELPGQSDPLVLMILAQLPR